MSEKERERGLLCTQSLGELWIIDTGSERGNSSHSDP